MKYREIELEDNKSVLVDSSTEIKNKDWYWDENKLKVKHYFESKESFPSLIHRFKIIATINHSIDLNVPMVIVEDEVIKLAKQCFKNIYNIEFIDIPRHHELLSIISKTLNYKAAQQKSYSEKDLEKSLYKMYSIFMDSDLKSVMQKLKSFDTIKQNIIQSLKQEYIELEMEIIRQNQCVNKCASYPSECLCEMTKQIKTNRVDGQLTAYQKNNKYNT